MVLELVKMKEKECINGSMKMKAKCVLLGKQR